MALSRNIGSLTSRFGAEGFAVAGILLMLLGDLMFALNDALGKWLVASFSVGQVVLIRSVGFFLFVILVAVGEDYNLLLMARVIEEEAKHGVTEGTRRAVAHTGGIISSCGLIMAGTFGALLTGSLTSLRELGFAFAGPNGMELPHRLGCAVRLQEVVPIPEIPI